VLKEIQALRVRMLAKYGYLDVSGWIEDARQGLR
jgi:hypothetical protein